MLCTARNSILYHSHPVSQRWEAPGPWGAAVSLPWGPPPPSHAGDKEPLRASRPPGSGPAHPLVPLPGHPPLGQMKGAEAGSSLLCPWGTVQPQPHTCKVSKARSEPRAESGCPEGRLGAAGSLLAGVQAAAPRNLQLREFGSPRVSFHVAGIYQPPGAVHSGYRVCLGY